MKDGTTGITKGREEDRFANDWKLERAFKRAPECAQGQKTAVHWRRDAQRTDLLGVEAAVVVLAVLDGLVGA